MQNTRGGCAFTSLPFFKNPALLLSGSCTERAPLFRLPVKVRRALLHAAFGRDRAAGGREGKAGLRRADDESFAFRQVREGERPASIGQCRAVHRTGKRAAVRTQMVFSSRLRTWGIINLCRF